jgi:hypothetical protein
MKRLSIHAYCAQKKVKMMRVSFLWKCLFQSFSCSQLEGIFCGMSSGATFVAAFKVAEQAPEGETLYLERIYFILKSLVSI